MVRHGDPGLRRVAAWPVDVLADETGVVRGFLMHRVDAREDAHELYNPRSRRRAFPQADFRFMARAASNLARAFAQVHALGHVIGDVNHGNALVGRDATVVLIDCDSFQIREAARTFFCDVGVPLFTPPELHGKSFRGLKRTSNHDEFGLAVLLFHLLYLGRHPFAGKHRDGELPIERAIAECRFAYGKGSEALGVTAPPATLPLGAFGPAIAELFERAFAGSGESRRTTAGEWVTALQALESGLVQCAVNERHQHPGNSACCWCELETRAGVPTFGVAPVLAEEDDAALALQLWKEIRKLPEPARNHPPPGVIALHEALEERRKQRKEWFDKLIPWAIAIGWILGAVSIPGFAIATFVLFWVFMAGLFLYLGVKIVQYFLEPKKDRSTPVLPRLNRWPAALARWKATADASRYFAAFAELHETSAKLSGFSRLRADRLAAATAPHEAAQLEKFLAGYPLSAEKFVDVTRADIAKLAAEGINHAGDVMRERNRLHHLLWLAAVRELLAWVDVCTVDFQFDSGSPQLLADLNAAEAVLEQERTQCLRALRDGPEQLRRIAGELDGERLAAERDLEAAHREEVGGQTTQRAHPEAQ
jgi:DNA-binding helix-hairpin-helix protein with protein kinase domain